MIAFSLVAGLLLAAPASPTQSDLDGFVTEYRAAFLKGDVAALRPLYFAEGPEAAKRIAAAIDSLSHVMTAKVTDLSARKSTFRRSPPADAKFWPNLKPVHDLHIGFEGKDGPDSVLEPIGVKDGKYRLAVYVPIAESYAGAEAKEESEMPDFPPVDEPAPRAPAKGSFEAACVNEIGLFCKAESGKTRSLTACLERNSAGLTKPCRRALRRG